MEGNTTHCHYEQLPAKPTTEIKTTNNKVQTQKTNESHKTLTTFTNYSPQIRKITNLFKNTNDLRTEKNFKLGPK
jgi:hypothetical protein